MQILKETQILDHGYVRLLGVFGDDETIAQSARVSYDNRGKSSDKDLIDHLIRHRHTSPIEQVEFRFEIKTTLFLARQLFRHRTASVNEVSGRYSELPEEFYTPEEWRGQSKTNKQGSAGVVEYGADYYRDACGGAFQVYHSHLEKGIAREQARMVLPLSTYTKFIWKQDLHNLLHLIKLRDHGDAQGEIQQYARAILEMIREYVPDTVASWENHVRDAVVFSRDELPWIFPLLYGTICVDETPFSKSRQRELDAKIQKVLLAT